MEDLPEPDLPIRSTFRLRFLVSMATQWPAAATTTISCCLRNSLRVARGSHGRACCVKQSNSQGTNLRFMKLRVCLRTITSMMRRKLRGSDIIVEIGGLLGFAAALALQFQQLSHFCIKYRHCIHSFFVVHSGRVALPTPSRPKHVLLLPSFFMV